MASPTTSSRAAAAASSGLSSFTSSSSSSSLLYPSSGLWMEVMASAYVLSGVCQPLLMTLCKNAGLANHTAQLYMLFYYAGPAVFLLTTFQTKWPSSQASSVVYQAVAIAILDVFAQVLNYTGASLAGPTIFAIVYSSVTVWTALWAKIVFKRQLLTGQWVAVCLVFGGLTMTAIDNIVVSGGSSSSSSSLGPMVAHGTILIVIGSAFHAGSYVFSEAVLTGEHALTVEQNTGLQCWTATCLLSLWQLVYTLPRWNELIGQPVAAAHTSLSTAMIILAAFGVGNFVHAYAFFYTIKFYKGGSVMAGVFKGLQAVLVFVVAHIVYCGRTGGPEMCFSTGKLGSLITVVSGVLLFSIVTPPKNKNNNNNNNLGQDQGSAIDEEECGGSGGETIQLLSSRGNGSGSMPTQLYDSVVNPKAAVPPLTTLTV